jgi:small subunit ribosomal protein S16
MTRLGRKNRPFFRVGVFDSRTRRDGSPVEVLGTYDPLGTQGKDGEPVKLDLERVKYWLSVGATPSEVMASILKKAGIPPRPARGAGRSAKKRAKAAAKGKIRKAKPAARRVAKPAGKD